LLARLFGDLLTAPDLRGSLLHPNTLMPSQPVKAFVVANYVEKEVKQALEKEGAEIIFSHEVE